VSKLLTLAWIGNTTSMEPVSIVRRWELEDDALFAMAVSRYFRHIPFCCRRRILRKLEGSKVLLQVGCRQPVFIRHIADIAKVT
jgi:hypothetical protein